MRDQIFLQSIEAISNFEFARGRMGEPKIFMSFSNKYTLTGFQCTIAYSGADDLKFQVSRNNSE